MLSRDTCRDRVGTAFEWFSRDGTNRDIETREVRSWSMHRRRFLRRVGAAGGVAATTALAGCSSVGGEPDYDVGMVADGYRPAELTVAVGDTVVWENTSARPTPLLPTRAGFRRRPTTSPPAASTTRKPPAPRGTMTSAARWRAATALRTPSPSPAATTTSVFPTRQVGCTRPCSWRSDASTPSRTVDVAPDETH